MRADDAAGRELIPDRAATTKVPCKAISTVSPPDAKPIRISATSGGRVRIGLGKSHTTMSAIGALLLAGRLETVAEQAESILTGGER